MSPIEAKARADAAEGRSDPPDKNAWRGNDKEENARRDAEYYEYKEAWTDKKREMEDDD